MGYGKAESLFFEDMNHSNFGNDDLWGFQSDLKSEFELNEQIDFEGDEDDAVVPNFFSSGKDDDDVDKFLLEDGLGELCTPTGNELSSEVEFVRGKAKDSRLPMKVDNPHDNVQVGKNECSQEERELCMTSPMSTTSLESLPTRLWTRKEALERYRQKKARRCFKKKIRYHCRKRIASDRPRVGGRFARIVEEVDCNEFVNLEAFAV